MADGIMSHTPAAITIVQLVTHMLDHYMWCCYTRMEHGPGTCDANAIHESELQNLVVQAINMALGKKDSMKDTLQRNVEAVLVRTNGVPIGEIDARLEGLQKERLKVANAKEKLWQHCG